MNFDLPAAASWLVTQLTSFGGLLIVILIAAALLGWLQKGATNHSKNRYKFQLASLAVVFCALVAFISALPVADSLRNQLLTLLGLVVTAILTLSSTSIAGNAMAGLMLRLLGSYRPGDFVHVSEYFGRVTEQNLFHTEIQTEDRDLLTLPNMFMAANPLKVIHATGTIVTATITLGYDVQRKQAQSLLKAAAEDAGLSDSFVLITNLGDFSVEYRVCGFLAEVKTLISARSNLRCKMLDQLHEAGVEIVSPNFMNQRQTPEPIIPASYISHVQPDEETANPEQKLFDKAERAQQLEDLKDNLQEIIEEIKSMEENLKNLSGDDLANAKARLEGRQRRQKAMERAMQYFKEKL